MSERDTTGTTANGSAASAGDTAMERSMGYLLIIGVLLASAVVLVGGVLYLRAAHGVTPEYRVFHSEPGKMRRISALLAAVRRGDPTSLIQLGILLLIATPVARVVFAVVAFLRERDWLYVGVSVTVLVVLLLGIFRVA